MKEETKEVTKTVIKTAFATWADKKWFQVLFIIYATIIPVVLIGSPILYKYLNADIAKTTVIETLNDRDLQRYEEHKVSFEQSLQAYSSIKRQMESDLDNCKCDYMFMIEYHNGSENIVTGIQFCKFDMTIEVGENILSLADQNKFLNENVLKYDILYSPLLYNHGIIYRTSEEYGQTDNYLELQLMCIKAQAYALTNLYNTEGVVFGSLLCVSTDKAIDCVEVCNTARRIETIVAKTATQKNNIKNK